MVIFKIIINNRLNQLSINLLEIGLGNKFDKFHSFNTIPKRLNPNPKLTLLFPNFLDSLGKSVLNFHPKIFKFLIIRVWIGLNNLL